MRKLLGALCVLALAAGVYAQDESFRYFFDTAGASESAPLAGAALSYTNPTVEVPEFSQGSARLYFYAEYGTANQWMYGGTLAFTITGNGRFTGGSVYNHLINGAARFGTNPANGGPAPGSTTWLTGSWFQVPPSNFGYRNNAADMSVDTHFLPGAGTNHFGVTLLGYVDVENEGAFSDTAQVFMQQGTSGCGGETITSSDWVYFGFGDAAVKNKKGAIAGGTGGPTTIADAYFHATPEPISLALLGLGALVMRRRR